jgi:hypothetical protein
MVMKVMAITTTLKMMMALIAIIKIITIVIILAFLSSFLKNANENYGILRTVIIKLTFTSISVSLIYQFTNNYMMQITLCCELLPEHCS